jgi:hypothetical protein
VNRFQQAEELAAAAREELPRRAERWLAAARTPLETLTMAALDPSIPDEEFVAMVDRFSKELPGLFDQLDHDAIAELMEDTMGASMANGISQRLKTQDSKTQDPAK